MSSAGRLSMLAKLTELRFQAEQGRFARVQSKEAALQKNLEDLALQSRLQNEHQALGGNIASMAAVDLRWRIWADQRRKAINQELATVLAEKQSCLAALKVSFGRQQAAAQLSERAQADLHQRQIRKTLYDS